MVRIILITFLIGFSGIVYSQKNKQVAINFDDLLTEINYISKSNNQYVKFDSVLSVLTTLQQKLNTQDSVISTLKKSVNVVHITSDKPVEIGYYIIIGAFKMKENADKCLLTKSKYPLSIFTFPTSKLNYVGYKVKLTDPFLYILNHFRQKIVKDAWVLKVTN